MSSGLSLQDAFDLSGLSVDQLWLRYIGIGGSADPDQLLNRLESRELSTYEHNLLAHAINEHFLDLGQDHPAAYMDAVLS